MSSAPEPPRLEVYTSIPAMRLSLDEICLTFIEAFTTFPRYEDWTEITAREFVLRHLTQGGWCSCLFNDVDDIIAFALCVPLENWQPLSDDFHLQQDNKPSLYLSTLVTATKFRRLGFADVLLKLEEERAVQLKYNSVVARTRQDIPDINSLLSKRAYSIIGESLSVIGNVSAMRLLHIKSLRSSTPFQ